MAMETMVGMVIPITGTAGKTLGIIFPDQLSHQGPGIPLPTLGPFGKVRVGDLNVDVKCSIVQDRVQM